MLIIIILIFFNSFSSFGGSLKREAENQGDYKWREYCCSKCTVSQQGSYVCNVEEAALHWIRALNPSETQTDFQHKAERGCKFYLKLCLLRKTASTQTYAFFILFIYLLGDGILWRLFTFEAVVALEWNVIKSEVAELRADLKMIQSCVHSPVTASRGQS